jgi:hypothetical protein
VPSIQAAASGLFPSCTAITARSRFLYRSSAVMHNNTSLYAEKSQIVFQALNTSSQLFKQLLSSRD